MFQFCAILVSPPKLFIFHHVWERGGVKSPQDLKKTHGNVYMDTMCHAEFVGVERLSIPFDISW